jgi:hypothetical protein
LHCSIYFPHAEENESSDAGKTGEEAKTVADAPETTTTEVQDPSSTGKTGEEAKAVADALETTTEVQDPSSTDKPEPASKQDDTTDTQPEAEPETKRIKSSHDTADTVEVGETRAKDEASDEDWQKIERDSVPHKVTIEDVVDESEMPTAKV